VDTRPEHHGETRPGPSRLRRLVTVAVAVVAVAGVLAACGEPDPPPPPPVTTTTTTTVAPATCDPPFGSGPSTVPVMGPCPRLDAEHIAFWFGLNSAVTYRASVPLLDLIRMFLEEGRAEGVRGDLAFAQSIVETGWFAFPGRVPPSANNFSGFGATDGTADYGVFPDEAMPQDMDFFQTFPLFGPLAGLDDAAGFAELKARALDENVQYIETIMGRPATGMDAELGAAVDALDPSADRATIRAALAPLYDFLVADAVTADAVTAYVAALETASAGIDDDDFTLRFQTRVVRNTPPAMVFAGLYGALAAAAASDKIVGINLVGPENRPVAMRDYALHMEMIAFLRERFPGEKVSLHAGELVPGLVPPEGLRDHIRRAVEVAGADRIGHGIDIPRERDALGLLRLMRERGVAVEINLTSNEFILGVADDAHPVRLYDHVGVPFVISTDDAGVSRTDLSGEYVLYASRYLPSYDDLKATAMDSIRYSFLSDTEKEVHLARMEERFRLFEARIADLAGGLPRPAAP